jgi:hypothetical protein
VPRGDGGGGSGGGLHLVAAGGGGCGDRGAAREGAGKERLLNRDARSHAGQRGV